MYVACSTLCFGRHPLDQALRTISELRFTKCDVGIYEHGRHMKPSEVAADVHAAAARLRYGPGLAPAAFSVSFDAPSEAEYQKQFLAICRLARQVAVSLVPRRAGGPLCSAFHTQQRLFCTRRCHQPAPARGWHSTEKPPLTRSAIGYVLDFLAIAVADVGAAAAGNPAAGSPRQPTARAL